jgi:hypothetical protein
MYADNVRINAAFPGNPNLCMVLEVPVSDIQQHQKQSILAKVAVEEEEEDDDGDVHEKLFSKLIKESETSENPTDDKAKGKADDDDDDDILNNMATAQRDNNAKRLRELWLKYGNTHGLEEPEKRQRADNEQGEEGGTQPVSPNPSPQQYQPRIPPRINQQPKKSTLDHLMAKAVELMHRGLAPLYTFVGMVNVRAGRGGDVRYNYKWIEGTHNGGSLADRMNPVNTSAKTPGQFVELNRHLGADFLDFFLTLYKDYKAIDTMIGDCVELDAPHDLNDISQDNVRALIGNLELQYAPLWVWGVIRDSTFRSILSASTMSAFDMALSQVRRVPGASTFTLKELICSEGVRDKFAFFVAYNFMFPNAGYNPNDGRGGSSSSKTHRWVNVERMRKELSQSMLGAQIWFESVYRGKSALYAAFKAKTIAMDYSAEPRRKRMHVRLLRQMPEHELFHMD